MTNAELENQINGLGAPTPAAMTPTAQQIYAQWQLSTGRGLTSLANFTINQQAINTALFNSGVTGFYQ